MSEQGDAIREVLDEAGVAYRYVNGGKHRLVEFELSGRPYSFPIDTTASDWRAPKKARAQMRRLLREHGVLLSEDDEDMAPVESAVTVFLRDGAPRCSSVDLAEKFDKNHKDVLRAYDALIADLDAEFSRRNFTPSEYTNDRGKAYRCIDMTRDGFSLLAMGFTGKQAAAWKVKYIEAFNELESQLSRVAPDVERLEARVAHLEGEVRAATDLLLDHRPQVPVVTIIRKPAFVRPSKLRAMRRAAGGRL